MSSIPAKDRGDQNDLNPSMAGPLVLCSATPFDVLFIYLI